MSKSKFIYSGTEVVTDDLRVAFVEQFESVERIVIRYHNRAWPFPEWDVKTRKQLTVAELHYDDSSIALF